MVYVLGNMSQKQASFGSFASRHNKNQPFLKRPTLSLFIILVGDRSIHLGFPYILDLQR